MSAYSDGPVAARESFPVPTEIAPLADSAAKAAALGSPIRAQGDPHAFNIFQ
jgi:hypothetical protein